MQLDDSALAALADLANEAESSRSSYWDHEVEKSEIGADGSIRGNMALGMVARKTDPLRTAAHWFLRRPYWFMGRTYPDFAEIDRLGRLIARRQRRQHTEDIARQGLSLALIRRHLSWVGDDDVAAVIGDGLGIFSSLSLLSFPKRRVIVVNLTKPLLVDLIFIRQAVPDVGIAWVRNKDEMSEALSQPGVSVIAVRADDARAMTAAPIRLAVNIASMQEMDPPPPPVIAEYFDILRSTQGPDTLFYCCNKLSKRLPSGTDIRFDDYPWRAGDRILVDRPCDWRNIVSTVKPPFWYTKKTVVWHRLAMLEKTVA